MKSLGEAMVNPEDCAVREEYNVIVREERLIELGWTQDDYQWMDKDNNSLTFEEVEVKFKVVKSDCSKYDYMDLEGMTYYSKEWLEFL